MTTVVATDAMRAKASVAIGVGVIGLAMVFSAVEKSTLVEVAAHRAGVEPQVGHGVLALMMAGVLLLTAGVFSSLTVWSGYLRRRTNARQAPAWALMVVMVVAGGMGLLGYASHMNHIDALAAVPTEIDWVFVAGQVLAGAAVVAALVALGVRWTPRHRPARATR